MLVALAAACGCTGTSEESQAAGQSQEDMATPQVNGTAPEQGERPQMDFASAAATLGVTEEGLRTALGEPGQGQNSFADAAAELNVSEEALLAAPGGGQMAECPAAWRTVFPPPESR
jgi:hypothetical protein